MNEELVEFIKEELWKGLELSLTAIGVAIAFIIYGLYFGG